MIDHRTIATSLKLSFKHSLRHIGMQSDRLDHRERVLSRRAQRPASIVSDATRHNPFDV
jgi:hypothetical protein